MLFLTDEMEQREIVYDQQREFEHKSQQRERWMYEEHVVPHLEHECDGLKQELKRGYVLWTS